MTKAELEKKVKLLEAEIQLKEPKVEIVEVTPEYSYSELIGLAIDLAPSKGVARKLMKLMKK